MEPALYFRILSIALGALMVLRWPLFALIDRRKGEKGDRPLLCEAPSGPTGKRGLSPFSPPLHPPFVAWLAGILALVVVAVTWWRQARYPVDYSLAVAVVATVMLVWTSQVLFNYPRFREIRTRLGAVRPGFVTAFRLAVALVGVALILLGIFVYH